MNLEKTILGIDISKKTFDICLLHGGREKYKAFDNNQRGFHNLLQFLQKEKIDTVHACMESTGRLYEPLALYLVANDFQVSVVNPKRIKGFAQSELKRSKTDKSDAGVIARFCRSHVLRMWQPHPPEIRELQEVVRYIESLKANVRQEQNRLESGVTCGPVISAIEEHVAAIRAKIAELESWLKDHIKQHKRLHEQSVLIKSIIGVSDVTTFAYLSELGYSNNFRLTRQVESFCGLTTRQCNSGTSVHHRERMSKVGNSRLRKALYMPAMAAIRYNPTIRIFAERLKQRGKPPKVIICAVMRKLLRIIYAVVTSGVPFDIDYRPMPQIT